MTAKHVLDNHYDHAAPQNESPFLTFTFADKGIDNERDILRPIRAWRIGELIHSDTTAMDQDDLILIEFNVLFHGYPDKFIDLDKAYIGDPRKQDVQWNVSYCCRVSGEYKRH